MVPCGISDKKRLISDKKRLKKKENPTNKCKISVNPNILVKSDKSRLIRLVTYTVVNRNCIDLKNVVHVISHSIPYIGMLLYMFGMVAQRVLILGATCLPVCLAVRVQ